MQNYRDYLGLGIAGNFALHLDQAGEAEDFKDIITEDEAAPKGMFPFYLPCKIEGSAERPRPILSTFPLSNETIQLPNEQVNVQAEPEVGLLCEIEYENGLISKITPTHFGAYNDCSIREAGREKISDKKNWGKNSKGIAKNILSIDRFSQGGIMDSYAICSFLRRDGELHAYGEDVELNGYSYFYEKLTAWIKNQINTQEDFGPLEDIKSYIKACNYPKKALISIGATRYTPYGESTFLQSGDEVIVVLYKRDTYTLSDVENLVKNRDYSHKDISILGQKVL